MNFIEYVKERWITYLYIMLAFTFSLVVYLLDKSFNISQSNANYIMTGWGLLFMTFVALDYGIFNSRVKRFMRYCDLKASFEELDDFAYPTDKIYAALVHNLVVEYEQYKADIDTKATEELEFITKWIHDVKVPISAARLTLENHEHDLSRDLYQSIDTEMFAIEESVQRVFYELKSNRFYDDYKIQKVSTKRLIAHALKGYSNFFSYNKIQISIEGEMYQVLTDEKWSGYILSQIISNAVKYTPYGGHIIINARKNDNEITLSIKNSGKGILGKDIGQVFNKGYTSSENRSGMKATGYGLYLSKKLSNMLGHRLTAESQYGEYAIFNLTFIENETIHHVTKM
ncbi:integral membrane sensor signal transduction histidine kinase [Alkaliphilus metalliredigens QYMF]|uniref:histidine kinase n=1 Tax=Alkaliphilus metalliredigens (strain QYMF) TaxID=293826 RepID=A6TN89_ALKMQ|nr:sensor histidine kinase [Alkaliphilus metalliredigens]ABR47657.1 integral membrane sensor signal transduction histidine kinase [Alkaliphilus metalliredigens QYMF]